MRTTLKKDQTPISSSQIVLPTGDLMETDIYTQEDGGIYVTQYYVRKGSTERPKGQTCFYCSGVKLGCVTCESGTSPHGNCVTGTIECEAN